MQALCHCHDKLSYYDSVDELFLFCMKPPMRGSRTLQWLRPAACGLWDAARVNRSASERFRGGNKIKIKKVTTDRLAELPLDSDSGLSSPINSVSDADRRAGQRGTVRQARF